MSARRTTSSSCCVNWAFDQNSNNTNNGSVEKRRGGAVFQINSLGSRKVLHSQGAPVIKLNKEQALCSSGFPNALLSKMPGIHK
mmetsp:Transcript_10096/g.13327  ORF Transcript_10096/g.13327 Transcript_10096/m.13327 type:complete len:84 (-) Transcript_10096:99-350(-)